MRFVLSMKTQSEQQIPFGNDNKNGKSKSGSCFARIWTHLSHNHPNDEDLSLGTPKNNGVAKVGHPLLSRLKYLIAGDLRRFDCC